MSGEEIQKEKKNKKRANGCLLIFLVIAGAIVYIGASSLFDSDSKNAVKEKVPLSLDRNYYAFTTDNNFTVKGTTSPIAKVMVNGKEVMVNEQGKFATIIPLEFGKNFIKVVAEIGKDGHNASIGIERITQEEKDRREAELEKEKKESLAKKQAQLEAQQKAKAEAEAEAKPDFEVTTEELYSMYAQADEDPSVWKKYDGKIVEITGMVDKAEDVVEVFKNPSFIQGTINEGKRYYICLADKEAHGCVVWAYSNSSQLIKGVRRGEAVTVVGQFKWHESMSPDLMNSEVKKIY